MQRALHSVKPSLRGPSNGPRPRILVRPWTSLLTPTRRCSPAPAPPAALCDARRFISTTPPRRQDAPAKYTIGWATSPSPLSRLALTLARAHRSNLTEREYHDISNTAMDHLTEYLEEKLEELDVPGLDVEYSVRLPLVSPSDQPKSHADAEQDVNVRQVGCPHGQARRKGHLRHQQAAAQQADLALEPRQVRSRAQGPLALSRSAARRSRRECQLDAACSTAEHWR